MRCYDVAKYRLMRLYREEYKKLYREIARELPAPEGETKEAYKKRMNKIRTAALVSLMRNNKGKYLELVRGAKLQGHPMR